MSGANQNVFIDIEKISFTFFKTEKSYLCMNCYKRVCLASGLNSQNTGLKYLTISAVVCHDYSMSRLKLNSN